VERVFKEALFSKIIERKLPLEIKINNLITGLVMTMFHSQLFLVLEEICL
jgi:hypothetical protein